jgi:hypothetical protein
MSSPVLPAGSPTEFPTTVESLDPDTSRSARPLRLLVSAFICVILLGQFLIGFSYHGGQSFPILSYPMFSWPHYDGERLNNYLVYASADGGPEQAYGPERLEIGYTIYQKVIASAVVQGRTTDVLKSIAASVCETQAAEVVTLNAYDSGVHITRAGPVDTGRQLQGSLAFVCGDF